MSPSWTLEVASSLRQLGNQLLAIALDPSAAGTSASPVAVARALSLLGLQPELTDCKSQSQVSPFQLIAPSAKPSSDVNFAPIPQPARLSSYGAAAFAEPSDHYATFIKQASTLPNTHADFETYCQLYREYATYVAAPIVGREALPLYELFHSLAALSFALVDNPESSQLLLVGGDIPAIQNTLYTIGSTGAAKALRGRSFYLGLITDMVMRYLLRRFNLPTANLLFNAGGNFLMLIPAGAAKDFDIAKREINAKLLQLHGGELYVALAETTLKLAGDFAQNFKAARQQLGDTLAKAKLAQFKEQAEEQGAAQLYKRMFAPQQKGGPTFDAENGSDTDPVRTACPVCHVDFGPTEVDISRRQYNRHQAEDSYEYKPRCRQCASFEINEGKRPLAELLRRAKYLNVTHVEASDWQPHGNSKPTWEEVATAFGLRYEFLSQPTKVTEGIVYRLNNGYALPDTPSDATSYGFRYLANSTPSSDDDNIRDTHEMAEASLGIPRYGVLRMDVDNLGSLFSSQRLDMPGLCAVSAALSLYFEGWLGQIAEDVANAAQDKRERRHDPNDKTPVPQQDELLPYIIYAGGDDIFVVASWDLLPDMADRVRGDLADYALRGYLDSQTESNGQRLSNSPSKLPLLTISGGLSVVDEKFPLYQAAADAHDALEEAKSLPRQFMGSNIKKYAFCLFGQAIGWEEYLAVTQIKDWIVSVVGSGGTARSLLRRLNTVNALYRQVEAMQARRMRQPNITIDQLDEETFYSRWQWRLVYSLRQFAAGEILSTLTNKDNRNAIGQLGLATRWAEFITRQAVKKQGGNGNGER